jgi:hypothetical protein
MPACRGALAQRVPRTRLPHGRGVPTGSHVPGSRTRCTRASLVAAGRTSPSSRRRMASACPGGTGADVPRLVQAQTTRGVPAFAHAWHPGDGLVEPPRGAQASERDQSGNSISRTPRGCGLYLREATSAIASQCPLYSDCGHPPQCPRLAKTGHCAKYGQNIGVAEPLEIRHLRNK